MGQSQRSAVRAEVGACATLNGHQRRAPFAQRAAQGHCELILDGRIRFSGPEKQRRMLRAEGLEE